MKQKPQWLRLLLYMAEGNKCNVYLAVTELKICAFKRRIKDIKDDGWPVSYVEQDSKIRDWTLDLSKCSVKQLEMLGRESSSVAKKLDRVKPKEVNTMAQSSFLDVSRLHDGKESIQMR